MPLIFAAGQVVTADDLNAILPKYIDKAADETRTSTTTFANDADFAAIAFGASEVWECELVLACNGDPAGDMKGQWTVTGGATIDRRHVQQVATTGTAASDTTVGNQSRAYNASVSYGMTTDSSVQPVVREKLIVSTTTAGTITYQWAQASSNAVATTVRGSGSYFIARRLA